MPLFVARETVRFIAIVPLQKGNMCLCLLLGKLYSLFLQFLYRRAICAFAC